MPDSETSLSTPRSGDAEQNHPGVWRALSFVLVVIAAIVAVVWVFQSRNASDIAVRNSRTLDADSTQVTVAGQAVPPGASVSVLGIDGRTRSSLPAEGAVIEIPSRVNSLVALFDAEGAMHGLALVPPGSDREPVVISPDSTARALLSLSPAILRPDLVSVAGIVDDITTDDAYTALVAAITADTNVSRANGPVEEAVAGLLDRVPLRTVPDQGCDSVLNTRAIAAAGACVEPSTAGITISNEQDRWILVFAGPQPWSRACAAVAPAGTPGSQRSVDRAACSEEALLAAPGPIRVSQAEIPAVINRVQIATSVQVWTDYAAPLLDLVGGSAGLSRRDNTHVLGPLDELVATSSGLIGQDAGFGSALRVLSEPASPVERHASTLAATRALASGAGSFVDNWDAAASTHSQIIDFYDRVGEQMLIADRLNLRWAAQAADIITIGAPS